jgi:hypothetical protein
MIITNTASLRKYISVNEKFSFDNFLPYINKAINSYIIRYVGKLHVELQDIESGDSDSVKNEAREHLRSAIANFAMFMYLPYFQIQMDSSGLSVAVNDNRKQPEWWQAADIRRELLRSGHESMDMLLEILEKNPSVFTDFHDKYSTLYKDLLLKNADEFDKYYTIFRSRQTYLAIAPTMRMIETQILKNFITKAFHAEIKEDVSADENKQQVKQYIQQAIVCFTIAKIYNEGLFHFDATGVKIKFDVLPNEKVQAIDYGKPAEQLQRAIKAQIENGTQFILLAKDIMKENFTEGLSTQESVTTTTIGSGGIIGL